MLENEMTRQFHMFNFSKQILKYKILSRDNTIYCFRLTLLKIELNEKGSSLKLTPAVTKSLVAPAHLCKIARRVKFGNACPMFEDSVFSNRPGQIDHTLASASDHTCLRQGRFTCNFHSLTLRLMTTDLNVFVW